MPSSTSQDLGLLFARISLGLTLLVAHGLPKVQSFSMLSDKFLSFLGLGPTVSLSLAIAAEVGGSLLVIFGIFSRVGSFLIMCTMGTAFFVFHAADPFGRKELPLVFLFAFTALFLTGPGRYSLQNFLKISSASRIPFLAWILK